MSDALSHCYRLTLAASRFINLIDSADVSITTPNTATDAAIADTIDLMRDLLQSETGSGEAWVKHPQHVARLEGFVHSLLTHDMAYGTTPYLRDAARSALGAPMIEAEHAA